MSRTRPDPARLLDCAATLARELHGIDPPEVELQERIDYVLWGRKQAWSFLEDGVITEIELRNLLIDHFDYECAHTSGRTWAEFDDEQRRAYAAALDEVLFGRPAR